MNKGTIKYYFDLITDNLLYFLAGFRSHDRLKQGGISAKELKSILTSIGEKLTPQEGNR